MRLSALDITKATSQVAKNEYWALFDKRKNCNSHFIDKKYKEDCCADNAENTAAAAAIRENADDAPVRGNADDAPVRD